MKTDNGNIGTFEMKCETTNTFALENEMIIASNLFKLIKSRLYSEQYQTTQQKPCIYLIIRRCARTGAFPGAFCVPNSVALASLTLQVVNWAIH